MSEAPTNPAQHSALSAQYAGVLAPYRVLDLTDSWGYLCG